MKDTQLLASSPNNDLGDFAVFSGFFPEELQSVLRAWGLDLIQAKVIGSDCYHVVRERWTRKTQKIFSNAMAHNNVKSYYARGQAGNLIHLSCGCEDALVGLGGVVWISPGRRTARISIAPDCDDQLAFDELIGATLTHATALAGCIPLHGMAAEVDGVGVLALGDSMAGKSTLALATLHVGGHVVSDDFLLAHSVAGRIMLSALRRDLFVREGSFELIPTALRSLFSSDRVGPSRMELRRGCAPYAFVERVAPQVIWFLDSVRRPLSLQVSALSQAEALSFLLRTGSPLFNANHYPLERKVLLPRLIQMVQSTNCFRVSLGSDLLHSPAGVVLELIKRTTNG